MLLNLRYQLSTFSGAFQDQSYNPQESEKISFKHKKLVAVYKNIRRNYDYLYQLFTSKNHKNLLLPNTTNLIEGVIKFF